MGSIRRSIGIVAVFGIAMASQAHAQGDARAALLIPDSAGLAAELGRFPRGAPATTTGSPTAFGANWGDFYVGAGMQSPVRGGSGADGAVVAGFGLLNSRKYVGLDVSVSALSTVNSGWGKRMGLNLKLHTQLPDDWGIAVGASTMYLTGSPADDNQPSLYGVVSKVISLEGTGLEALTLSVGAGNEGFRLEQDILSGNKSVGAFGSAAVRVFDQLSVIVDWPGQDLNVGVSIVPIRSWGIVITPAIVDITGLSGTAPGQATVRPRFSIGTGWTFAF